MSRAGLLMILGVLVVLAPVSGLPLSLRAAVEFVLGAAVFLLGLTLRMRDMRRAREAAEPTPIIVSEPPVNGIEAEVLEVKAPSESETPPSMGAF